MTIKRARLYESIKRHNLQDVVKKKFSKNYTRCSDKQLEEVIKEVIEEKSEGKDAPDRLTKLVEVLRSKRILLNSEVNYILQ